MALVQMLPKPPWRCWAGVGQGGGAGTSGFIVWLDLLQGALWGPVTVFAGIREVPGYLGVNFPVMRACRNNFGSAVCQAQPETGEMTQGGGGGGGARNPIRGRSDQSVHLF